MTLEHTAESAGTLGAILRREMGLSSTLVKRLKWRGAYFLNGLPAHTDARVLPGDQIRVEMAEAVEGFAPEQMELEILYEDESLLAVDKPAGLLMHPSPQRNEGTLANGVLHHLIARGEMAGVHPVTRLDRDTMGVALFAKTSYVHAKLCAMQRAGALEKVYRAAVFGVPAEREFRIDLPIGRVGGGSLLRTVDPQGKPAQTDCRVLASDGVCAILELHPLTGRTHQLRLHCMASGFPILGDPQYRTEASAACSAAHGLATQQLAAHTLRLRHPVTGDMLELTSRREIRLPEIANGSAV